MPSPPHHLLVVQPLPGIGDMVWHLPHIRALARHAGAPITLVAKPRSLADQLFAAEDTLKDIIWLDRNPRGRTGRNDGPIGFWRLVRVLRAGRFGHVVLLHHSHTLALATLAAGIPVRQGYGAGAQRWFLNRPPFLSPDAMRAHQYLRATAFLHAAGIPLEETEPRVAIAPGAREAARARLGLTMPYIAMGIGSSEAHRQWGAVRMAELGRALLEAGWPRLVLIGGSEDSPLVAAIQQGLGEQAKRAVPALGWHLADAAALMAEAGYYVGNDTGVMNLAAAAGARSYALFGASPVLRHSRNIVPVVPSATAGVGTGMQGITVAAVLSVIERDRGAIVPLGNDQPQSQPAVGPPSARTI